MNTLDLNATGKTIVVTGSNAGIGRAAAYQLARLGANVVMVCRNPLTGNAVRSDIIAQTGNPNVTCLVCDLSSQNSIREFVRNFESNYERLDVLINNAANFDQTLKQATLTSDGVETIFATNHLGPFLMTNLLRETLKKSAPARVLNVASKGLVTFPFLGIEFDNLNGEKHFSTTHAYYHSKLAQVMFTYDLAERWQGTGVSVNCSRVTNVQLDWARLTDLPRALRWAYSIKRRFAITAEQMADSYVRLVLAPEFEGITGKYFDENCREVKSSAKSHDRTAWKRLWDVSAQATHLDSVDQPRTAPQMVQVPIAG